MNFFLQLNALTFRLNTEFFRSCVLVLAGDLRFFSTNNSILIFQTEGRIPEGSGGVVRTRARSVQPRWVCKNVRTAIRRGTRHRA